MSESLELRKSPFTIGHVRADPEQLSLTSEHGQSNLEPKVMHLLQVFAASAGRTLSRDALIDAVWGVQFGGDESLTRAVHLLRKGLSAPHGLEDVLRTIPRRGYIFDHTIDDGAKVVSVPPKANEPLLAVLPFDNLSADPDAQFFSDGISEDIIDRLGRTEGLRVIGRTSSFQFRGDRKFEAAHALGATHIVDGSVRRAGQRIRVSAHLETADTRETLWSDRYDRDLKDIFDVQDAISSEIASALDRKIEALQQTVMAPDVYDLYLQGHAWTYSTDRLRDAMKVLEQVTQAEPNFAPAWGALARNRAMMRMYQPVKLRDELDIGVREAIERALALDPHNQDALNASYQRLDHFGPMLEHHDAIEALRSGIGPGATGLFLASFHESCIGLTKQAYESAREAARLDPFNPISASYPAVILDYLGHYEEARQKLEQTLIRWPQDGGIRGTLASVLAELGDEERLDEILDPKILARYPMSEFESFIAFSKVRVRRDGAQLAEIADKLEKKVRSIGAGDTNDLLIFSLLVDSDRFYDVLDNIRIGPVGATTDSLGTIAYRSTLFFQKRNASARADPRFIKFCARLGLVRFWLETGIRPDFADEISYDFDETCREYAKVPIDVYNPFREQA